MKNREYIVFFHHSDEHIEVFNPRDPALLEHRGDRPLFYWFSDRYHSLYGNNSREGYFYLFFKHPPTDNIEIRARHEGLGFDSLYRAYLEHKNGDASEPGILMSFSKITPDLVLKYNEKLDAHIIVNPKSHKGQVIRLFDDNNKPIPFNQIREIIQAVPQLKNSHPFIEPGVENGKYIYDDWQPMITERMGVWL